MLFEFGLKERWVKQNWCKRIKSFVKGSTEVHWLEYWDWKSDWIKKMLVRIPSNKTKSCYWIFGGSNARPKPFVGIIFISKFELLELKVSSACNDGLMFLTEAKLLLLFILFLEVHIHKKWNSNNENCWNWLSVILHPLGQFRYRYQVQVNFMGFNTQTGKDNLSSCLLICIGSSVNSKQKYF